MGPVLHALFPALENGPSVFKNNVLKCRELSRQLVSITQPIESLKLGPLACYERVSLEN